MSIDDAVAKVLRERYPVTKLEIHMRDADAILQALDEHTTPDVPQHVAELVAEGSRIERQISDLVGLALTPEQEIQARALDAAARVIEEWERATRAATFWIEHRSFRGPFGEAAGEVNR